MGSDEYKIRMEGEYYYNKNNIVKLQRMLEKYHASTLEFTPTCNIAILENLDLENVESGNYFLVAPPVKIGGAEAAPVRAMLITDYIFWSGDKN